jgi:hypothetical protein
MNWMNEPDNIEDYFGFIYCITNLKDGRKYIGRKHFWTTEKKKPTKFLMKDGKFVKDKKGKRILNTRTTKKHIKIETDWKEYWGSCNELLEDVEKLGKENFNREIIYLCKTKWDCAYHEARIQFEHEVLLKKEYYNGIINLRIPARK